MKYIRYILLLFVVFSSHLLQARKTDPVRELLQRVTDRTDLPVSLTLKNRHGQTYYDYKVDKGILQLKGSSPVALCRGFYDYVKSNGWGMYSWAGNSISLPSSLEAEPLTGKVSPFAHHYYLNVVTYGYTMPYWDWHRWEKEIDWMALHGIDMPLALVGYEAILARVWKKMGLTDEEINSYFVGPAHLPWMRMGNISGIDGPLNADWHKDQIALQHKILDRMRALGMKPICPGFPGFIPQAFRRLYPDLNIVQTEWAGAFHNWMLSPEEPLFSEIARNFIVEWEKEFGKNGYYLVDSFNEMEIPFPEKGNPKRYEMAAHYGEKVYESIKAANPDAVWVMQGWMFGYQRHIWDFETLGALVSKVPDDRMLLLDLAVDYNRHFWKSEVNWEYYKGFYNKLWVYSVIPNMGGKVGMTGVLDFYANGHLDALASPNRGQLFAHGLAPEGIENNEVLYELVTDAGWSDSPIDVKEWLKSYSLNRYGASTPQLMSAWEHLLHSCYGTFTDHPRFNWQHRPGLVREGSINISDEYFKGLEEFVSAASGMKENPMLNADLIEMTAHYLGGKAEILTGMIEQEYLLGDTLQARFLQSRFYTVMSGMDALLSCHPLFRLDRWLDMAAKSARTEPQREQYLKNARRIVTIWGPPVDDYSARIWSGLIKDYYLPRWMQYYEARNQGKESDLAAWERRWVEHNTDRPSDTPAFDVFTFVRTMISQTKDITRHDLRVYRDGVVGSWHLGKSQTHRFSFDVAAALLKGLQGISLEQLKGNAPFEVRNCRLVADGRVVAEVQTPVRAVKGRAEVVLTLPQGVTANNGCSLEIVIASEGENAGTVSLQN